MRLTPLTLLLAVAANAQILPAGNPYTGRPLRLPNPITTPLSPAIQLPSPATPLPLPGTGIIIGPRWLAAPAAEKPASAAAPAAPAPEPAAPAAASLPALPDSVVTTPAPAPADKPVSGPIADKGSRSDGLDELFDGRRARVRRGRRVLVPEQELEDRIGY